MYLLNAILNIHLNIFVSIYELQNHDWIVKIYDRVFAHLLMSVLYVLFFYLNDLYRFLKLAY